MILEPYQIVRELVAGSLFFMNIYLVYAFFFSSGSYRRVSWSSWRDDPASWGATFLATYFLGAMALRGWEWALALLTNLNTQFDYPKAEYMLWMVRNSWALTIVAGGVAVAGGLGVVYVFAPRQRVRNLLICVFLTSVFLPFAIYLILHGWP